MSGNAVFSEYLGIPFVQGAGELAIFCACVIGACLAFLWFNAPPAAVFMGDTGSLALGGALGAIAVSIHHEIVLAIVGGLFVLEAVSVIVPGVLSSNAPESVSSGWHPSITILNSLAGPSLPL